MQNSHKKNPNLKDLESHLISSTLFFLLLDSFKVLGDDSVFSDRSGEDKSILFLLEDSNGTQPRSCIWFHESNESQSVPAGDNGENKF